MAGRPKTVAILREEVIQHGGSVVEALVAFIEKHKETADPKMADVWERACVDVLDRLGLTPASGEKAADAETAGTHRPSPYTGAPTASLLAQASSKPLAS